MKTTTLLFFMVSCTLAWGCSGSGGTTIPNDPKNPGGSGGGGEVPPATPPGVDPTAPPSGPSGNVIIHVRANAKTFPHADGYAGQTPRDEYLGIRALALGTSKDDPNPVVVFDNQSFVEARLNDGDDTVVAKVPASKLKAGNYTWGRTFVTHARYKVDATAHASGFSTPGEYDNILALSDNTDVKGKKRMSGDLETTFRGGGQVYGPYDVKQALPQWQAGGIAFELKGGQASYVYPATVTIDPTIKTDVDVVYELNMYECFRWEDQTGFGYQKGVWDAELTGYEPVKQFSANSFTLSVAAAR